MGTIKMVMDVQLIAKYKLDGLAQEDQAPGQALAFKALLKELTLNLLELFTCMEELSRGSGFHTFLKL